MLVTIADDHCLFRRGLISLLREEYPAWDYAEALSINEVLGRLNETPAALLLIEPHIAGVNAVAALRALRQDYPHALIAALTGTDDREVILACLDAGVHGYILKSESAEHLLGALKTILAGGVYVPDALDRVPPDPRRASHSASVIVSPPRMHALTRRQLDVMRLLAEGHSTKTIARSLDLAIGTVKIHLAGIYRAFGARNRMEAVIRASQFKLDE